MNTSSWEERPTPNTCRLKAHLGAEPSGGDGMLLVRTSVVASAELARQERAVQSAVGDAGFWLLGSRRPNEDTDLSWRRGGGNPVHLLAETPSPLHSGRAAGAQPIGRCTRVQPPLPLPPSMCAVGHAARLPPTLGSEKRSWASSVDEKKWRGIGSGSSPAHRYVSMVPFPLTGIPPVAFQLSRSLTRSQVLPDTWMHPGTQVDSMREAVLIVSPNMENLGILEPITPVMQGPVWMPMRTCKVCGGNQCMHDSYKWSSCINRCGCWCGPVVR